MIVETLVGRFTYIVTGQVIVSPNDYQQVIPTRRSRPSPPSP